MMKAVRITKANKSALIAQYEMPEDALDFSSGLYLVAGFGDKQYEGLIDKQALMNKFFPTGRKLDNDFFEITRKSDLVVSPLFSNIQ